MKRAASIGAFALALALGTLPASAQDGKGETAYAYYYISCGNYILHRDHATPGDANATADLFYVAGWLSAYNRLRAEGSIPEDTTLDDVMFWLDGYCRKNPLSNLHTGLYELGEDVAPRHGAQDKSAPPPAPDKTAQAPPHKAARKKPASVTKNTPKPAPASQTSPPKPAAEDLKPLDY